MPEVFDFETFPVLETERLILRELADADAVLLFEYFRTVEYTQYLSFDRHTALEHTYDFIAWTRDIYQKKDSIRWALQLKASNHVIGTAGLHLWKRDIHCIEAGYHIGPPYWGKGFATEVLRAMADFGFWRMDLNRLEARHNDGNDASARVLEKAGFRKEGIWRQRELKEGRIVDAHQYSLLRDDYLQGR